MQEWRQNVDITPQMVSAVRQSRAAYKAALETKQRDRAGEKQNMRENRKCKNLTDSLEQQKRLKLDELVAGTGTRYADSWTESLQMTAVVSY